MYLSLYDEVKELHAENKIVFKQTVNDIKYV